MKHPNSTAIDILDLSYRSGKSPEVPWLLVNCVFRISESDSALPYKNRALANTETYLINIAAESPELLDRGKGKKMWVFAEPDWKYLPKFDVFWFRQWVSDCSVTRSCLQELRYFEQHGYFPSFYRQTSEGVFLRHLHCLSSYWD